MKVISRSIVASIFIGTLALTSSLTAEPAPGHYKNFRTAIYIVVNATKSFSDRERLQKEFDRVMEQVKFDKVYLEVYRDKNFADESTLEGTIQFFKDHGIEVWGGITLSAGGGKGGQFGTFDFEKPADRAECKKAVEMAARHFDHVILDDFFFYTSKSDMDIRAEGKRSWTQYRLDTMRKAARELVLGPARKVHPGIQMIIKYPNWYEHFQGLGYDLDQEARDFDFIYTGTETRDPVITDQLLQQYESYQIYRYLNNIKPGRNLGGWVDIYSTRYVDRYAEQLWDTLFAKAPEITLFNWSHFSDTWPLKPGDRDAWKSLDTSFDWDEMVKGYHPVDQEPLGWGRAAGYSLEKVDGVLGDLGRPIGIASYKPYQSTGEDFLHNYLGNIGIPIDLYPEYPSKADTILLTECAKFDKGIVGKIEKSLREGKKVFITSGLLGALQDKGIREILEAEPTGRKVLVHDFIDGFGAGNGASLNDPKVDHPAVLFPEIRFLTNDAWGIIRGVAAAKGFPIILMNHYSKGIIYVLTIPENISDLYNLPQALTAKIKSYLMADFPVRIDSPAQVSLFAYDNDHFVVESFRPEPSEVTLVLPKEGMKVRDTMAERSLSAQPIPTPDPNNWWAKQDPTAPRTEFKVTIPPHSYRVYAIEK
ncbi:MAG TPA: hypothetical protein VHE12_08685 [bacterium]|nr:hypothetical protein [bacterium]